MVAGEQPLYSDSEKRLFHIMQVIKTHQRQIDKSARVQRRISQIEFNKAVANIKVLISFDFDRRRTESLSRRQVFREFLVAEMFFDPTPFSAL